jgi:hypothetical protein
MEMTDRNILRGLAARYAECANSPLNQERKILHRAVNDRRMVRPVVLLNEIPWGEFSDEPELKLHCTGESERRHENFFRHLLFQWRHFPGDMTLMPFFPVHKHIRLSSNGVTVAEHTRAATTGTHIQAHEYIDQFACDEDLEKLCFQTVTYDSEASMADFCHAAELFGDLLPIKLFGVVPQPVFWDQIARYRGVGPMLADLYDRPEFMHALVGKLTDIFLDNLRQYTELDCLEPCANHIHATASAVSDLPPGPSTNGKIEPKHLWGRGMAQIFASVSPAMHDEFDIQYMKRALEPFGMVYYGCCEPLDNKIGIVTTLPRLRKIGVTPWADPNVCAEQMGSHYVMAFKPNPAFVAVPDGLTAAKTEIRRALTACRRNGTSCDVVLKDISTVGGDWRRLAQWEQMAMREVQYGVK